MKAIDCYLNFDGNAREAMTFYAKCLDAKLDAVFALKAGYGEAT